jgi:hypothetical protein
MAVSTLRRVQLVLGMKDGAEYSEDERGYTVVVSADRC